MSTQAVSTVLPSHRLNLHTHTDRTHCVHPLLTNIDTLEIICGGHLIYFLLEYLRDVGHVNNEPIISIAKELLKGFFFSMMTLQEMLAFFSTVSCRHQTKLGTG